MVNKDVYIRHSTTSMGNRV